MSKSTQRSSCPARAMASRSSRIFRPDPEPSSTSSRAPTAATTSSATRSRMISSAAGPLPVGDGERLAAITPDPDPIVRATAEGRDPKTTPVKEAMTPGVVYVYEDQDIEEAASLMKERQIRRLVVLNRNKR